MRPTRTTQTAAGNSAPIILDTYGRAQVALQVQVSGTVNYTVQQTMDNLWDTSITPSWQDHPDPNLVGNTADAQGYYTQPPFATRVKVNSGSGSATLTALSSATN